MNVWLAATELSLTASAQKLAIAANSTSWMERASYARRLALSQPLPAS